MLYDRPARTLVVADLVHNMARPNHRWTRWYAKAMGFCERVAISRLIRWTAFRDKAGARRAIEALLVEPFERIVVGHGAPVVADAREQLAAAYRWLPAMPDQ